MQRRHQIIWVECTIHRSPSIDTDIAYTYQQELVVTAFAEDDVNGNNKFIDVVKEEKHIKKIVCPSSTDRCNPISVFNTHDVLYNTYHVRVKFVHPGEILTGSAAEDIQTEFTMHYVNVGFTNFQFSLKVICLVITLLVVSAKRLPEALVAYTPHTNLALTQEFSRLRLLYA